MQDYNTDHYEALHLHPSAHPDVIQAAYRRLALLYHPDRNPSPEATDLMAQLNSAYEVLSNPEKRAEYDRIRESQRNTRSAPGESATASSGRPSSGYSSGTQSSRGKGTGFFTLGSTKNAVSFIQGPPHDTSVYPNIGVEIWHYGVDDHVELDMTSGLVQGWINISGTLKIRLAPGPDAASYDFFTEGDHRDEVARLQGTPAGILVHRLLDRETWYFPGGSTVEFSFSTGRVKDWEDDGRILKARRAPSDGRVGTGTGDVSNWRPESGGGVRGSDIDYFDLDSTKDDVNLLQGRPNSIRTTDSVEIWRYGRSWVAFSRGSGIVSNWSNADGTLKVSEPQPYSRTGFRPAVNWRTLRDEFNPQTGTRGVIIYTVDPIEPDYSLIVRFWNRELHIFVDWDTEISYSDRTTVNWQIDDGTGWQQLWKVDGDNSWTVLPGTETAETLRALMDAETFSVRVYPFGGNPITASFNVRGLATAVGPVLEAWRQAGSPTPGQSARGIGCFMFPVLGLAAAVVVPAIWLFSLG